MKFLLKHDRLDRFRYAPLQSSPGREVLVRFDIQTFPDRVMLLTDALTPKEHLYRRSDAVRVALQLLGGGWRVLGRLLGLVPRPLRDWGRHRCTVSLPALRPQRHLSSATAGAAAGGNRA